MDPSGVPDAVWSNILKTGQLPDGHYNFCVEAFEITSAAGLISAGSSCYEFNISLAQAPIIISPFDGQNLNPQLPNTVFSWTPPIGNIMGANIVYDLYVVKIPQGSNPNDVMNAAVNYNANNPVKKINLTGNQYVTQPYDLQIDTNTLYAVQVVARDLNKQVSFVNDGRSEVVTFTKGKTEIPLVGQIKIEDPLKNPSQQSPGFNVTNLDPVPMSQLKGKLVYSFKDSYTSASVSNQPILGGPTANTNNPLLTAGGSSNLMILFTIQTIRH
ncbi:MAG: hypothetical protein IPJ93_06470 [Bacteroidota bacterium]|nr:MAG: hypothetical protein IPJ93_06470 [Bacteroidota bacterium]